jgi:hypothetical protein
MPHLIIRFTSFSILSLACSSSSYAAHNFVFRDALSKFFFLRKKIFCFLCSLLCCNTHSKIHVAATQLRREIFQRRMNFMYFLGISLCTIGFTRSALEFPACFGDR